jgi:KUP system potassium uptake protein
VRGRKIAAYAIDSSQSDPLAELAEDALAARPPERVEGTAIFLSSARRSRGAERAAPQSQAQQGAPRAEPGADQHRDYADPACRTPRTGSTSTNIDENFSRAVISYGFMENPDVPQRPRGGAGARRQCKLEPMRTSYFIGRSTLRPSKHSGMPFWQDLLFIFLYRNASDPTDFFRIPANRVVELGSQTTI